MGGATPHTPLFKQLFSYSSEGNPLNATTSTVMSFTHDPAVLSAIGARCAREGVAAWLVGGAARSLVARRMGLAHPFTDPPDDLDITVAGDGLALARMLADQLGGSFVTLDSERNTGRVVLDPHGPARLVVDLVQLRAATMTDDLRLRDFTLNALAIPLDQVYRAAPMILDPCGGQGDMAARCLQICAPQSLADDPVRLVRGVRLATALGLTYSHATWAAMQQVGPNLGSCAAERVRDELLRLLDTLGGAAALQTLDEVGALTSLFPELEAARNCTQPHVHFLPVLAHALETVVVIEWLLALLAGKEPRTLPVAVQHHPDLARTLPYAERLHPHFAGQINGHSRGALLKLATLLHDNAKPQTKQIASTGKVTFYGHQELGAAVALTIAQRLRLSRQAAGYVATIVKQHMRPGQLRAAEELTVRAVVRFFRDIGDAGPDVLLHSMADHLASSGPRTDEMDWRAHLRWVEVMLAGYWGRTDEQTKPFINGNDLIQELHLEQGPLIGRILRELHEAQASGEIGARAEAIALAQRLQTEWQNE